MLWQVGLAGDRSLARFSTGAAYRQVLVDVLARDYPLSHEVIIYRAATLPVHAPRIERRSSESLPDGDISISDTLVIPPARPMRLDPEIQARVAALDALYA